MAEKETLYVTRLAYNNTGWQRPASDRSVKESGKSFRAENGFGHEDWLFRNEWIIDGWRYGFVQGVNNSRPKLLKNAAPFDLRLFAMFGPGDRRYVAEIREAECLPDEHAKDAVAEFRHRGWLGGMRHEIESAGGKVAALDTQQWAPFIINLRFRLENLRRFTPPIAVAADDPVSGIKRYTLCGASNLARSGTGSIIAHQAPAEEGSSALPATNGYSRFLAQRSVDVTPEHAHMQKRLMEQLRAEYPDADVRREAECIDVVMRRADETVLYEIKSDLNPLSVVRQALGQIMEYAFHPSRTHQAPVRLVIVGRRPLEGEDLLYFESIRNKFALPIEYMEVAV